MFASINIWILMGSSFVLPGGFLLYLSKSIQKQPLSDRSAHRLFHALLMTITLIILAMYPLNSQGGWIQFFFLLTAPLLVTLVAMTGLHLYRTHALRSRRNVAMLLIYLMVIGLVNIWYIQREPSYAEGLSIPLALVGSGLIVALVWQTVRGHSPQLWFVLISLIVAVGIYNFAYNGLLRAWPGWLLWLLDTMGTFLIPVILIALAGRVAAHLAGTPRPFNWRRWLAGAIAAGLLVALLIVHLVDMFLLDGFADWGVIGMPTFFAILTISVALLLIWTLDQKRISVALAYLIVMAAAIVGLFALVFTINNNPEETTIARAEQVNQAVLDYYADKDSYPAALYDLIPRYLLTIPNPVLYSDHVWCYQGGPDFYRLAYVSSPVWRAPSDTFTIHVQGSAGEPTSESWECDTLLVEYRDHWNGDMH